MNITHDMDDTKQTTIKEPKSHDSTKIVKYLKEHFGEEAVFDKSSKTIYLCNNDILKSEKFLELMLKYKFFIQPSLI